jgi:hypothetical protein
MTAAEMIRAMDLYRQLSGRSLVETGGFAEPAAAGPTTVPPAPEPAPDVTAETPAVAITEPGKPVTPDATVTALDITRKRT